MRKERTPESTFDELINLVPVRKISRIKLSSSSDNMLIDTISYEKENADLNSEVTNAINYYLKNENEEPRFCYILHEKKDGILAAKSLSKKLSTDSNFSTPIYNPEIDEKMISSYIKKSSLKKEALEAGYVKTSTTPVWKTMVSVIAGLLSALGLIAGFLEFISFFDENNTLRNLFTSLGIIDECLVVLIFAVFVGITCSIIIQRRNNDKTLFIEINKIINDLSNDEFLEFLDKFHDEDFCIQDCNIPNSMIPVYICVLQNYNFRQRHILKAYWATRTDKQIWWIFSENTNVNKSFVLNSSTQHELKFYQLKPLSTKEKKKLAAQTYSEQINFHPTDDAGIKIHGADYICRFKLKTHDPIVDAKFLNEKIHEFSQQYNPRYQADIKLIIRLIAELSCNYYIDFTNRRNWEYLFDYNHGNLELNSLDRTITAALHLDNGTFINLIPEINHVFSDYFEEILADYPNTEQISAYEQWCLIKALKCRGKINEERCSAIADTLMNEFANARTYPEDLHNPTWITIIFKTLEIFYTAQFFWFLPTIINNLIHLFEKPTKNLPNKIFSSPIVLKVAKANLLLNISAESDSSTPDNIDLIRDHYEVAVRAVQELDQNFNLNNVSGFPSCLELLQFTNIERQRYCNALNYLKELDIFDYYNYLFDIYCASLLIMGDKIKFCYKKLHENALYDKYAKNIGIQAPTSKHYIQIILEQLLELLDNIYGNQFQVIRDGIRNLQNILSHNDSKKLLNNIYFLLAQFDILEVVTLNFIACLIARLDGTDGLSKDVYLNLGNYLIGLVFLTYHENMQSTFYNDDFIYLVRICTNYTEPCGAILGYLYYCDTIFKPSNSAEMITEFIKKHKTKYLNDLQQIVESITSNNIEAFFSFLGCMSITPKEKTMIYERLREIILSNYVPSQRTSVFIEYLTLYIDGCSSPDFLADTAENNLKKLDGLSNDTVYFIYGQYLSAYGYESDYFELFPLVAEKILASSLSDRCTYVTYYALVSKNKESEEYIKTAKQLYEYLQNTNLNFKVHVLKDIASFIQFILDEKEANPLLYQWINSDDAVELKKRVKNKQIQQLLIQSKEFLTQRSWGKYGMVLYLRYLMTDARLLSSKSAEDYAQLDANKKTDYIISNFKNLQPFIRHDGYLYYNKAYVDMLVSFIYNNDDIQNRLNEKECLQKFVSDSITIVDKLPLAHDSFKVEVHRMIHDYTSLIDRI